MAIMLEGQALMHRALMDVWARILGFSMILDINITLELIATRAINVVVLLVFSLCWKLYMGCLHLEPNILMLILPQDRACSYGFFASLVPCAVHWQNRWQVPWLYFDSCCIFFKLCNYGQMSRLCILVSTSVA